MQLNFYLLIKTCDLGRTSPQGLERRLETRCQCIQKQNMRSSMSYLSCLLCSSYISSLTGSVYLIPSICFLPVFLSHSPCPGSYQHPVCLSVCSPVCLHLIPLVLYAARGNWRCRDWKRSACLLIYLFAAHQFLTQH